jgi:hypothetical protein
LWKFSALILLSAAFLSSEAISYTISNDQSSESKKNLRGVTHLACHLGKLLGLQLPAYDALS